MGETGYYQRKENFDVIMVKTDVKEMEAKPEDFKRVSVSATEPGVAADEPEVIAAAKEGFRRVEIVGSGKPSDYETMARARAVAGEE